MQWYNAIEMPDIFGWIEIFVLAVMLYYIFVLFRGTRGAAILSGMIVLFVALFVVTSLVHLDTLNWLLQKLMAYIAVAIVVIFQPEIRRALAQLGRQPNWRSNGLSSQLSMVDPLIKTVRLLSKQKIGALIAVEREIGTRNIQDTGIKLSSRISAELLSTIFFPRTPLHDGGVILAGGKIRAAGCLFPLSQKEELSKTLGTRHRAAIGITEETDAVVIVVSEETGTVSVAYNGRLRRGIEEEKLRRVLTSMLRRERTGVARFRKKLEEEKTSAETNLLGFRRKDEEE